MGLSSPDMWLTFEENVKDTSRYMTWLGEMVSKHTHTHTHTHTHYVVVLESRMPLFPLGYRKSEER